MPNIIPLSVILLSIVLIILFVGYLYICWKNSEYKTKSKYWFFIVHTSIFYESIPKFLHSYLKEFLWLYWEYHIYRTLEKIPGNKEILINLYLPQWETVDQTEIDILFIHTSGIYIIESKDFGGWIYGNINDTNWTQSFSKYRKYSFYNPIRQNYSHKKSLEKILPDYINKIKTMIVFSNRSTLKNISHMNNETIIQRKNLKERIMKNPQEILSLSDIENITQKLNKYWFHSKSEMQIHIQQIQHLQNYN
jgi:hypothetical protein